MNPNYRISHPEAGEGRTVCEDCDPPRLSWVERKIRRPHRKRKYKRHAKRGLLGGANAWYPSAVQRQGNNAGYAAGRNSVQGVVAHYTVGRDSTSVGDRGYFHFLVRRNGEIVQFAEVDAVTWHACEWNRSKVGIEVEYYEQTDGGTIITPEAEHTLAELLRWLEQFGFPVDPFHDGDHSQYVGNGHMGTTTHRDLRENSCDWHYDWWPEETFNRMRSGAQPAPPAPPPRPKGEPKMFLNSQAGKPEYMIRYGEATWELVFPQEYMSQASTGMPHSENVGDWVMEAQKSGRTQVGVDVKTHTAKVAGTDRAALSQQLEAL